MKCPKCGTEMQEDHLYCEHCGEEIHIVPDFEPEIEFNLEQALNDIVRDIHDPPITSEPEQIQMRWDDQEAWETVQDWDKTEKHTSGKIRRFFLILLICVVVMAAILGSAVWLAHFRHYSLDYQIEKAENYTAVADYDRAVSYYERALELDPANIELKFALADVYFKKNNKMEYEYLLRDIVNEKDATLEQLESAYGKLIAIYSAREDYKTVNELILSSDNESIKSIFQSYLAPEPEFGVKGGYYNKIMPLKLTTFGTGKIYYTMDGSDPDENSTLYTTPILLEDGNYTIKAVYVNEMGIVSNVVSADYYVYVEELPPPEINAFSGEYSLPTFIEVLEDSENIYYTTDGSTPNAHSAEYRGRIPMPLGKSVYKFIRIADGKSSEVVERTYKLKLNTDVTPQQAVDAVVDYELASGKIYDGNGHFDYTEALYIYEYLYPFGIVDVGDFYMIAEVLKDVEGNLARTGNFFAVDIYNKKVYKLLIEEGNNYTLMDVE
ncbi:MAG: tetratricopeptide repeat protein [Lachnospiraceae bacterium]|nr:tetratricopeptide repeat protein [Lachnospiraceae bacterium]